MICRNPIALIIAVGKTQCQGESRPAAGASPVPHLDFSFPGNGGLGAALFIVIPAPPPVIPAQAGRARAPTFVLKSVGSAPWPLFLVIPAPLSSFPRRRESRKAPTPNGQCVALTPSASLPPQPDGLSKENDGARRESGKMDSRLRGNDGGERRAGDSLPFA